MDVWKLVQPIYMDLIKATELAKCLHGKTQNQNESYNAMIWERVPKTTYVGIDKLEFATYDAAANFNDGRQATIDMYKQMGLDPGRYTSLGCITLNRLRKSNANYKVLEATKKARKIIRAHKKMKEHNQKKVKVKHTKLVDFSLLYSDVLCYIVMFTCIYK